MFALEVDLAALCEVLRLLSHNVDGKALTVSPERAEMLFQHLVHDWPGDSPLVLKEG